MPNAQHDSTPPFIERELKQETSIEARLDEAIAFDRIEDLNERIIALEQFIDNEEYLLRKQQPPGRNSPARIRAIYSLEKAEQAQWWGLWLNSELDRILSIQDILIMLNEFRSFMESHSNNLKKYLPKFNDESLNNPIVLLQRLDEIMSAYKKTVSILIHLRPFIDDTKEYDNIVTKKIRLLYTSQSDALDQNIQQSIEADNPRALLRLFHARKMISPQGSTAHSPSSSP